MMQSLISLTFDDGLRCQFEKAVPILASHGIRATFFLTANQEPTHESWYGHRDDWWKIDWREDDIANLRKLIDDGNEIGSHSLTHRQQTMQGNPLAEARESKELIECWLGQRSHHFAIRTTALTPILLMLSKMLDMIKRGEVPGLPTMPSAAMNPLTDST
jgi:peptidoglycan/xylan/chitin deacetylase (PgdA/CDA1 family)